MLILEDRKFIEAAFDSEEELERVVIANSEYLFGPSSLYFPKALIRTKDGFGTIPDGFVVDLAARRWFVVEAELAKHSVWSHIAPQVAKQIIAAMNPASRQLLADLIVERVREHPAAMEKFADEGIEVIDIRRVLGEILEANPTVGMPIDGISSDLREWASTLRGEAVEALDRPQARGVRPPGASDVRDSRGVSPSARHRRGGFGSSRTGSVRCQHRRLGC